MGKSKNKAKKALLKLFKSTFPELNQCDLVHVKDVYELPDKKVKIPKDEYPIEIYLHSKAKPLQIYPEKSLVSSDEAKSEDRFLLFDPNTFYSEVSGFYRLEDGDKITLGGENNDECEFFKIPKKIAQRKLSIFNDEGTLVFKSHTSKPKSCIYPVFSDKKVNKILKWRLKKIDQLKNTVGNPDEIPSKNKSLELIKKVNSIMRNEIHRPKNKQGQPGGVIAFPKGSQVVLVGDLHAKPDNLLVILTQNGILEALESKQISVVIIGDAVHPEGDVPLDEMENSMVIMDMIFKLKIQYPEQLFYLRGNHDSFSKVIAKGGIPQGVLWEKALVNNRGKEYLNEMNQFYQQLPYLAYSNHFVTCHAAPPTSSVTLNDLINIHSNDALIEEVINNRIRKSNRPAGYTKGDIKRLRKCMGVTSDTPVIVGHTVISNEETIWEDVGGIENHHVLYSSDSKWVGTMIQIDNKLHPIVYPVEQLTPLFSK